MTYSNLIALQKPFHPGLQQPIAQEEMDRAHVSAREELFENKRKTATHPDGSCPDPGGHSHAVRGAPREVAGLVGCRRRGRREESGPPASPTRAQGRPSCPTAGVSRTLTRTPALPKPEPPSLAQPRGPQPTRGRAGRSGAGAARTRPRLDDVPRVGSSKP